jgi:hypothetical protein
VKGYIYGVYVCVYIFSEPMKLSHSRNSNTKIANVTSICNGFKRQIHCKIEDRHVINLLREYTTHISENLDLENILYVRITLSKKTRKKTKTRLDKTVATPALRYSCETWILREHKSKGKVTISRKVKSLRNVAGNTFKDQT